MRRGRDARSARSYFPKFSWSCTVLSLTPLFCSCWGRGLLPVHECLIGLGPIVATTVQIAFDFRFVLFEDGSHLVRVFNIKALLARLLEPIQYFALVLGFQVGQDLVIDLEGDRQLVGSQFVFDRLDLLGSQLGLQAGN